MNKFKKGSIVFLIVLCSTYLIFSATVNAPSNMVAPFPSEDFALLAEAQKKAQLEYERISAEMKVIQHSLKQKKPMDNKGGDSTQLTEEYKKYQKKHKRLISDVKVGYDKILLEGEDWKTAGGSKEVKTIRVLASDKLYTSIDVFYATDRKSEKPENMKDRFGSERDKIRLTKYGITQVSIPFTHEIGEVEEPSFWRFEFSEDPEKHITITSIKELESNDYFQTIKDSIKKTDGKSALIFIHGYNVSFEDAAKRTGQMAYDLEFKGIPAFYSWPSQAKVSKYTVDEANIKWSQPHIESFIEDFSLKSGVDNIYLIAHSMGARGLTNAYINALKNTPSLKSKFKEIILAAPDIDADIFKDQIAPKMADIGTPVTLYASSEDKALKASHKIHGNTRAGDSGDGQLILDGVESIDSTNVKSDFIGHSSYADNVAVLSDLYYLINRGLRPDQRRGLDKHHKPAGVYWKFKETP
jgi:esterase/lipase superfamily enzyme